MAVISVTFAKLYSEASARRIPRFENERFEATATVETDVASAFAEARAEVEAENARREALYVEAERQRQEAYEAEQQRRLEEREARRLAAITPATTQGATDEPPF